MEHPDLRDLAKHVPDIALKSRQDGTVKGYLSGFRRWKNWASHYPEINIFPAEPKYVSLYLTSIYQMSNSHAPVTYAFYSLSWAHKAACLPDPKVMIYVKE